MVSFFVHFPLDNRIEIIVCRLMGVSSSSASTMALVSALHFLGNGVVGSLAWMARDVRLFVCRAFLVAVPAVWAGFVVGATRGLALVDVLGAANRRIGNDDDADDDAENDEAVADHDHHQEEEEESTRRKILRGASDQQQQQQQQQMDQGGGHGFDPVHDDDDAYVDDAYDDDSLGYSSENVRMLHVHLRLALGCLMVVAALLSLIGACLGGLNHYCCPSKTGGAHKGCCSAGVSKRSSS